MDSLATFQKSEIPEHLEQLRRYLTLPNPKYEALKKYGRGFIPKEVPETLNFYEETDKEIRIPRCTFYMSGISLTHSTATYDHSCWDIKYAKNLLPLWKGELRDYQENLFNDFHLPDLWKEESSLDLILEMPCGHGKTITGLYLACQAGFVTLVLAPKKGLVNQWLKAIKKNTRFTPAEISHKLVKKPIVDADIFVGTFDMYNAVLAKNPEYFKELGIGTVLLDEVHRLGAETFLPIERSLPVLNRIALTATFRRKDEKIKILEACFCEHRLKLGQQYPEAMMLTLKTGIQVPKYLVRRDSKSEEAVRKVIEYFVDAGRVVPKVEVTETFLAVLVSDYEVEELREEPALKKYVHIFNEKNNFTSWDTYITENAKRMKLVQSTINRCLEAGRTILVLGKRKAPLQNLHKVYAQKDIVTTLITAETADMSEDKELEMQLHSSLLFGIDSIAKEGLDVPRLDTLILLHPISDVEQAIGRILRFVEGKKQPLVIYFLDNHRPYLGIFQQSLKFAESNSHYIGEHSRETLLNVL